MDLVPIKTSYVNIYGRDITERKMAEGMLRQAKDYTEKLIDTANVIVLGLDAAGRIQVFNEAAERITGYTRAELAGRDYFEVIVPRDRYPYVREAFAKLTTSGLPTFENPILTKSGEERLISRQNSEIREQGKSVGTISFGMDITERKRVEEALRETTEFLTNLLENTPTSVYVCSVDGRLRQVNRAWEQFTGLRREKVVGSLLEEIFPGDTARQYGQLNQRAIDSGAPVVAEEPYDAADGRMYFHTVKFPLRDVSGQVQAVGGISIDITDRKEAEEALRGRTQQLDAVRTVSEEITRELDLPTLLDLILRREVELVGAPAGGIFLWDEAAQLLTPTVWSGYEEGGWVADERLRLGEGLVGLVGQERQGRIVSDYRNWPGATQRFLAHTPITAAIAEPLLYRDRLVGVIALDDGGTGRPFTADDQNLLRLLAPQAAIAIENARLFQSVSAHRGRLRELAIRLAEADEAQRRQVARELHDRVGQNLTALSINLSIIRGQLPTAAQVGVASRLDDSVRLLEETVVHIRDVMAELRPPVLDDYGLVAALRWYGDIFSARTGITTVVRDRGLATRLRLGVETAMFRIAQEGLTNVAKHARASRVILTVERMVERTRMIITDDGMGFIVPNLDRRGAWTGWGLIGMEERAAAVGGTLRVQSAPGQGTQIVVEVPR